MPKNENIILNDALSFDIIGFFRGIGKDYFLLKKINKVKYVEETQLGLLDLSNSSKERLLLNAAFASTLNECQNMLTFHNARLG